VRAIVDFHFWSPEETDDGDITCMVKSIGLSGAEIASIGGATSTSMVDLFNNAVSNSDGLYKEAVYQKDFQDGKNFNFLPGDHFFKIVLWMQGAPGTTTTNFAPETGTVYSTDIVGTVISSSSEGQEWNTKPTTGTSFDHQLIYIGTLKVETPSNGSPYGQFIPVFTFANTVGLVQFQCISYRLPSAVGNKNAAHYNQGNSSGTIELKDGVLTNTIVPCNRVKHTIIKQSELDEFRAFQKAKDNAIVLDISQDRPARRVGDTFSPMIADMFEAYQKFKVYQPPENAVVRAKDGDEKSGWFSVKKT